MEAPAIKHMNGNEILAMIVVAIFFFWKKEAVDSTGKLFDSSFTQIKWFLFQIIAWKTVDCEQVLLGFPGVRGWEREEGIG